MYIRDSTDPDTEESEDELPPMKSYLDKARELHAAAMETVSVAHARHTGWVLSQIRQRKSGQLVYMMSAQKCRSMVHSDLQETMLGPSFVFNFAYPLIHLG